MAQRLRRGVVDLPAFAERDRLAGQQTGEALGVEVVADQLQLLARQRAVGRIGERLVLRPLGDDQLRSLRSDLFSRSLSTLMVAVAVS